MLQFLLYDLSATNEELGEMSFSVLSNAQLKHRSPDDIAALAAHYRLLPTYRSLIEGLRLPLHLWTKTSDHISLANDEAIPLLVGFLVSLMTSHVDDTFQPYSDEYDKRNLPPRSRAEKETVYPTPPCFRSAVDLEVVVTDALADIRRTLDNVNTEEIYD